MVRCIILMLVTQIVRDFFVPFRGQRYHLNEWHQGYQPSTLEEFFNMKHASAHNF
ncbi:hypothetical protein Gotur_002270 [Gossypium turneri]